MNIQQKIDYINEYWLAPNFVMTDFRTFKEFWEAIESLSQKGGWEMEFDLTPNEEDEEYKEVYPFGKDDMFEIWRSEDWDDLVSSAPIKIKGKDKKLYI